MEELQRLDHKTALVYQRIIYHYNNNNNDSNIHNYDHE